MTTPADTAPEQLKMSTAARIGWIVLICVTLYVCYFSHLGAIGFVGPDEPRYAWVAREMVETGDWVTPRLYGRPWFEKPPLYYWGAAICFKFFGVSEAPARLTSAVSALLATLAMAWLAWRMYGAETARWLLLLLSTTVGMIGFSHAAATDMPLSGMLTIAMVCAAVVLGLTETKAEDARAQDAAPLQRNDRGQGRLPAIILFGFFLGLAVLAKGPAAIILCGGAVFFWALFTKRWREALRLLHPVGIASFCATALPWYILCARRNPDFFRVFIIEHNFKRYLTPEFQHIQPFWFYIPIVFLAIFPWSMLAVLGSADFLKQALLLKPDSLFLLMWFALPLVFFSISQSKLPGYILPVVPPLVLLTIRSGARTEARFGTLSVVNGLLLLATIAAFSIRLRHSPAGSWFADDAISLLWPWTIGFASVGLFLCVLALSRKRTLISIATGILAISGIELSDRYLLPNLDTVLSARTTKPLVEFWHDNNVRGCVYELRRSWVYALSFYAHMELSECSPPMPLSFQAITSKKGCEKLEDLEKQHILLWRFFTKTGIPMSRDMYLVGIFPFSAGAAGGKAQ